MSFSLKRAMGWGLPWEAFVKLTLLDKSDLQETMYDTFNDIAPEELVVDKEYCSRTFKEPGPSIIERHLLSTTFTSFDKIAPEYTNGTNLFFTDGYDQPENIGFFPNANYASKWLSRNSSLDFAFELWRDSGARHEQAIPRHFHRYVGYGFEPWTNYLMDFNGNHVEWDHYIIVEQHPEWVPAVPPEIRWYLKKLGILNDAGINCLRPLISQWYS